MGRRIEGSSSGPRAHQLIRDAATLALAVAVVTFAAADGTPTRVGGLQAATADCIPEVLSLPRLTTSESSYAWAINDRGWVAGTLWEPDEPFRAVLWRDDEPPLALGLGGIRRPNGRTVSAEAVDVNERGVVAIQRTVSIDEKRLVRADIFLWHRGKTSRLPATHRRPSAWIAALNDHGVAVGSIHGRGLPDRPVVWRNGTLLQLPTPEGMTGVANDINNHGLIVGSVGPTTRGMGRPWWWRVGGGSGPLRSDLNGDQHEGHAELVDDDGRIVGRLIPHAFRWEHKEAAPQELFHGHNKTVADLHASGYITGDSGSTRSTPSHAIVAHLTDARPTRLPDPTLDDAGSRVNGSFGLGLGRGATPYASSGGVTVAGAVFIVASLPDRDVGYSRAVLWTCAQTYRR